MVSDPSSAKRSASNAKFAIVSSRVVTGGSTIPAAVVVQDDTIIDVVDSADLPDGIRIEDVGDLVVSPGLIDAHVHVNEPGRTEWEGFESATSAAAAGGVTTIIDMPLNSSPVTTNAENLRLKREAATGKCHVDVGFYAGLVPGNEDQIEGLLQQGVMGVKAFLCDSGLDEFPAAGEAELRGALKKLAGTGVPLLAHAEIIPVDFKTQIDDPASYIQYANSRPPKFELLAIELLIKLCREFDSPIHIVHLATAEALEMIKSAKQEGLKLSVETCPHYFYFCQSDISDGQTSYKCAPPIRDKDNRDRIVDAIANGLIETIGSDHSPCTPDLKSLPTSQSPGDFTKAWGGIAGLQLTLPVTRTVGQQSGWSFEMMAERLSSRPADLFGLTRKGRIEAGFAADLVVWDPDSAFVVAGKELFHRHPVTPYEGRELKGTVSRTFVSGKLVFDSGKLTTGYYGTLLKRRTI